jgi:hypothetical protein
VIEMSERKTIVINLKKTLIGLFVIIVLGLFLFQVSLRLNLQPSPELNGSTPIFEQKENYMFEFEILRYHSRVNVTQVTNTSIQDVGINADRTNLHMGRIPRGSSSVKRLNLTNNQEESYSIKFYVFGNVSELMEWNKSLVINPGENIEYPIIAETGDQTPLGMYYGEVDVVIVKPKNSLAKALQWMI